MLLYESGPIVRPEIEDADRVIMDGFDDESLTRTRSSPDPCPRQCDDEEVGDDDSPFDTPINDVSSCDEFNFNKSCCAKSPTTRRSAKSKKRVQFLPDGILVRIRFIPPRSNKSSSESDGSASESDDDSDGSDSETTATDSEDVSSDRDTPSPAIVPTESKNKFATMPPLMYAAKGSYNVAKSSGNKNGLLVAKITGINRPVSPSQSQTHPSPVGKSKKGRRLGSPKQDKGAKKNAKANDKADTCNGKRSLDDNNKKGRKKRVPLKFKEGKISPPPPAPKPIKSSNTPKPPAKLSQRRSSGNISTSFNKNTISSTQKRSQSSTVTSTSVKSLSNAKSPSSISTSVSPSPTDMSMDRVSRAMQSLSMGKLYTVDGFIFPPHHANELHLPELALTSKSEDFSISVGGSGNGTGNGDGTWSPRRSFQVQGNSPRQQPNQNLNIVNQSPNHQQQQQQQQMISPSSANRKRRYYAWQMANGNIQNTLSNTPNISQLWDNISMHPESMDKTSCSAYKQM